MEERGLSERRELVRLRAEAAVRNGAEGKLKEVPLVETWRERFDAAYKLREGEVLRRIAAPFIAERDEYYRREHASQAKLITNAPDYFVFRQDDNGLHNWGLGFVGDKHKLELVLRRVLGLKRYELSVTGDLLDIPVNGDWVFRDGTSMESRLAALEPVLQEATGRKIGFKQETVEDDVIAVRGNLAADERQKIDVFAEKKNEGSGGGGGDFKKFLEELGDRLNVAFTSEVQLQNEKRLEWYWHADSDYSRAGEQRAERINKILQNLNQQTGLSFELQRRPTQVWVVHEKP